MFEPISSAAADRAAGIRITLELISLTGFIGRKPSGAKRSAHGW